MIRPTPRSVVTLLAGLLPAGAPVLFGDAFVPLWLASIALVATALAIDFARLPSPRRLAVRVDAPLQMALQQPGELRLTATAAFAAPIDAVVELIGDCEPLPPAHFDATAGQAMTATLSLRPHRRGTVRVVAVHLRWRAPFGLLWREHTVAAEHSIKVLPDIASARQRAMAVVTTRDFRIGARVERYVGDGSEFESLRDFVPGMDRRAVDWKASARHRTLLCRQFRAERNHQIMLCVDAGRLMGEPLDGVPRLDHAIHAALQLGQVSLRIGDRVGMFAFADRGLATLLPAAGATALQAIQDRLAGVDYASAETNYTRSLTDLLQQLRRRTLVVLFTEFVDSIGAELMLPNVQRLARRHVVLFVALRDPLLPRLAAALPRTAADLHKSAVAATMQRERDLVLERIRRSGAHVVDAESAALGAELVQRYLVLKRRELA